ncbi:hypothetical protein DXG03_000815 [Asterophora parasitica]|uniref:Uncharacterized protein n=1 Tax=Asterophora parasitica TaxID=117018 RepID=A0A9P7KF99_9AGAR|nr:hypothetical protein DXG03_000815 [Asterophora parasitica]
MSTMGTVQYLPDIQTGDIGAMDTSPITQHPNDMTPNFMPTLSNPLPAPPVPPQLMQEPPPVFPNMADPSTILATSMHVPMSEIPPTTVFLNPMPVAPGPHIGPGPSGFLSDIQTLDPFAMAPPPDNAMNLELAPVPLLSTSPPAQIPSASIHGTASSYSVGVTSSLESALDQPVVAVRSRANTSVSPPIIPPGYIGVSMTPAVVGVPYLPPEVVIGKQAEVSPKAEAESVVAVESMLEDIEQTAKHARHILHHRHDRETSSSINTLNERISQVTQKFAGLLSISSALASSASSYSAPLSSPGLLVHEPTENPLSFPPAVIPSISDPMDVTVVDNLGVIDHSRKRCASELEEHRSVKAPKREPQDDIPLTPPAASTPPFAVGGITLPSVPIKSQPASSRPPTPPTTFSSHRPFNPMKLPLPPTPTHFDLFPPQAAATTVVAAPAVPSSFPGLHSSWSDSVVPTRHHHSLSAGSIILPQTPPLSTNSMVDPFTTDIFTTDTFTTVDPFTTTPLHHKPLRAMPGPFAATATIGPPIGRMSRSGSINGTFPAPYGFGYMEAGTGSWTNALGHRVAGQTTAPTTPSGWFPSVESQASGSSVSPASSSASAPASDRPLSSTVPNTTQNSPTEDKDDDDDDDDDDDNEAASSSKSNHSSDSPPGSSPGDIPQEYRAEVDRIFFEYLNKICSNLDATDSKGEPIHQTLMAKKMQRLDESPDFRPFKFRIQAFTMAFLEELAKCGYPEEKIPMKKYILRFNEDGKKAKSKGNHIWNIEAKRIGEGKWDFRPFHRKLAGAPPPVAYAGLKWSWTPRVWDPQASWQNVPVEYSSPSLPSWLAWNDDELSGVPPPDAESCQITVNAKFVLDGQEGSLSHIFQLAVAPGSGSSIEAATVPRSRRPSLAGEPPRRSTSDSVLFQQGQRAKPRPLPARRPSPSESPDTRVIRVLQSVAQRVSEEAHVQLVSSSPPKPSEFQELVKQKQVLDHTVDAYDKALTRTGDNPQHSRRLAVAAQNVVVQAAHTLIADRTVASGGIPHQHPETVAIKSVTVTELSDATQGAIAAAVKQKGKHSTEVDIMVAATSILKSRTATADPLPVTQQPRPHPTTVPRIMPKTSPYPLSSVSEYV